MSGNITGINFINLILRRFNTMKTFKKFNDKLAYNYIGGLHDSNKLEQLTDYFTDLNGNIWQFKVNNKWYETDKFSTLHFYQISNDNKIEYQLIIK